MIRLFNTSLTLQFWASPYHSMNSFLLGGTARAERVAFALKVLDPGFPRDNPPEIPPSRRVPTGPTDVPVPEPHDVPIPQPMDVPPPDPGDVPPIAKPPKRSEPAPKPRRAP